MLNRRGFLGALAAVIALPFAPKSRLSAPGLFSPASDLAGMWSRIVPIAIVPSDAVDFSWEHFAPMEVGTTVDVSMPPRFLVRER